MYCLHFPFPNSTSAYLQICISVLYYQLLSARDMAQRTFIGQDRIVYSTDKDLYEQDYEAREWDRRLKEIENSD